MKELIELLISLGVELSEETDAENIGAEVVKYLNSKLEEIKKLTEENEELKKTLEDNPPKDTDLEKIIAEKVNAAIKGTGILNKKPAPKKIEKTFKKRSL